MPKPGIPPARIPEITKSSHPGMTFTLTLEANTDNAGSQQVVRRTSAVKQRGETRSSCEKDSKSYGIQGTLRFRSVVLFLASASAELRFVVNATSLVLLQIVFMVWEIVLTISAW